MDWDEERAERFEGQRGRIAIWSPVPGVIVSRVEGHADLPITRFYIARAQRELLTQKRIRVFHHWGGVTSYDADARDAIRAFGKSNRDERVLTRHLVKSKILGMAIETAGLVLQRDFKATSDERTFERWIDEAVRATSPRRAR